MKNKSIINPELHYLINKKKMKIEKEIKIPQPFYKKFFLTIKNFFVSLK